MWCCVTGVVQAALVHGHNPPQHPEVAWPKRYNVTRSSSHIFCLGRGIRARKPNAKEFRTLPLKPGLLLAGLIPSQASKQRKR